MSELKEELIRKFRREVRRGTMWKTAFTSASVESFAIDLWIVEDHAIEDPLNIICSDCIERRSGVMFPNAASTKPVGNAGSSYVVVSVGDHLYLICSGGPRGRLE